MKPLLIFFIRILRLALVCLLSLQLLTACAKGGWPRSTSMA